MNRGKGGKKPPFPQLKSILKKDEKKLDKPILHGYNKRVLFEPPV